MKENSKEIRVDELGRTVEKTSFGDTTYTHESYGMLGFYRVQGTDRPLFGSSLKHNNTIRLTLKTGVHSRNLNRDLYYGGRTLFEVEMSASQFADLVSNMNIGDGVPVTIKRKENELISECPFENKAETHIKEFNKNANEAYQKAQEILKNVTEMFNETKTFKKKDKEEILSSLTILANEIGSNISYQVNAFQEQVEKSTTEAKAEIEAFYQNRMLQIAKDTLKENPEKLFDIKKPVLLETEK